MTDILDAILNTSYARFAKVANAGFQNYKKELNKRLRFRSDPVVDCMSLYCLMK